jgi:hypothetical protein
LKPATHPSFSPFEPDFLPLLVPFHSYAHSPSCKFNAEGICKAKQSKAQPKESETISTKIHVSV